MTPRGRQLPTDKVAKIGEEGRGEEGREGEGREGEGKGREERGEEGVLGPG